MKIHMKILSKFIESLWVEAMDRNVSNIISLLDKNSHAVVLDVGCGDGRFTVQFKNKIQCKKIIGTEGNPARIKMAEDNGVDKVVSVELEKKWPFPNNSFDVIISNQVIEHILNIDHFIEEIYRLLRPGGYCVISTENLSAWHNIGALVLGYQDFSHNLITKKHVGNPFSIHYGEKTSSWEKKGMGDSGDSMYPHIKIATYKSLINIFKAFDFTFVKGNGSGYYPLFGFSGSLAVSIDPYHTHFITVKMQKPKKVKKRDERRTNNN